MIIKENVGMSSVKSNHSENYCCFPHLSSDQNQRLDSWAERLAGNNNSQNNQSCPFHCGRH